jgi:predicted  nucleic acid-binding Zn-ribbon protein
VAYKGVDEKLVIAHSETNLSVDDTREMNVQIVGSLFVDRTLNVGANVSVSYPQGVVTANAFIGDGGLLSNLVTDLQSVTDNGANTIHTVVLEHPVTGLDVKYGNVVVAGNVTVQDMVYVGIEPVALQRDLTDNASRVSILETDLSDNASRVSVLETDLSDNASRVSVLETDLSDNASRVSVLETDLSDNASRVSVLETDLSDNASRVSVLETDLSDNASRVSVLETDLSDNASRVSVLETDLSDNASRVSVLETDLSDNASRVSVLETDLSDNASRVSVLETDLSDNASRVSVLETDLSDNASRVSVLETDLSDNASRVSVLETDLSDNASRVSVLETDLSDNASRVSVLETDLSDNASRVSVLETDLSDNASRVSVLETDLSDNASRVSVLETDLSDNASRVSVLETDLSDNASRVSVLETDLSDNASRVSVLETDLSDNASRVSVLETDLSDNASRVSVLETDLSDNASRVSVLETDLADNASRVSTLETVKADLLDPTFTSNIIVSNNLVVSDLTPGRVVFVGASNELTDDGGLTFASSTLTVDGDVYLSGNLSVEGQFSALSTVNTIVDDPIIQLANNNVSDTLDMGIIMTRPSSNVAMGYRGNEAEFMIGHTLSDPSSTDIVPDTNNSLSVHVYGDFTSNAIDAYGDFSVNTNTFFVDVSENKVGVLTNTPGFELDVRGTANVGALTATSGDVSGDFSVDTSTLFVDSSTDRVGVNTTSPGYDLDVRGSANVGALTVNDAFEMVSTDDGSAAGPEFTLWRNSATPANGDYLGQIKFAGENSTGGQVNYAKMTGKISESTAGAEDGLIEVAVQDNSSFKITTLFTHTDLKLINGTGLEVAGDLNVDSGVLYADVTTDRVGVNTTAPGFDLDVRGTANVGALTATSGDVTGDFSVDTNTLFVDASENKVGVLTTTPGFELDIRGDANCASLNVFTIQGLQTLSFTSDNTTTPPLQLTAGSLNDGVGALRIDSVEPDIFLNDTDGGFSTITFADDGVSHCAFGRNSSNNFYLTVRDPSTNSGNWRDDTLVANRLTGDISLGYKLSVNGATLTGSNVLEINGTANAVAYYGDGGFLSNLATTLEEVTLNGNTTPYTVEFNNTHTAFVTDLVSNIGANLEQLNNVTLTSPSADQTLTYDGDAWINEYSIQNFIKVYNDTGGDLTKGKAVYIVDSHNNNVANVALAVSSDATKMPSIGLMHDTVATGNEGVVVAYGKVNGIPTNGFIEGETVYVSNTVPGGLSNVKPFASTDLIQNVGICIKAHATNGVVFVTGVGRSNDIGNAVVKTTAPNYVYVNDTNNDLKKIAPENLLTKLQTLTQVVNTGNTSSNTLQLTNATTGLVATGNVEALAYHGNGEYLANVANISILESNVNAILLDPTFESNITVSNNSVVYGGTIACLDTVPYKRYGHAGAMTNSNIGVEFSANVFYSKIIAQLTEGYSNVSTIVLEVQGGKKPGGGTAKDIQVGTFNKFGFEDNDYPWSSTVVTTPTKVVIEPFQAGTTDYSYSLSIEYMTSTSEGQVETISEGATTVKTFDY